MNISKREFELLILISCSKFKNPIAIINLVKLINIDRRHPTFMKIKKMLILNEIVTEHETFGNAKLLDINIKKLDKFIKNTELYKTVANYIRIKDKLLYQP